MPNDNRYCLWSLDGAIDLNKESGWRPSIARDSEAITQWKTRAGALKAAAIGLTVPDLTAEQRTMLTTATAALHSPELVKRHITVTNEREQARKLGQAWNAAILEARHLLDLAEAMPADGRVVLTGGDGEDKPMTLDDCRAHFDATVKAAVDAAERKHTIWPFLTAKRSR